MADTAATPKKMATLISPAGDKVVVESGSQEAQQRFGQGYVLYTGQAPAGNQDASRAGAPIIGSNGIVNGSVPAPVGAVGGGSATNTVPTSISEVKDRAGADAFINGNQESTISNADAPPVRSTVQSRSSIASELKNSLGGGQAAPEAPNFTKTFTDLREQQGVAALEDNLNTITTQENELKAALEQYRAGQEALPLAQRVVEGRVSEAEKRMNTELDRLGREKSTLTSQLNTKYSVIQTTMNLTKMDYDAARDVYDKNFSRAIQMFDVVSGIEQAQKNDEERKQDNARANLQILSNAIKDSTITELTDDQKLTIRRLEMQAGLPAGTVENFKSTNPKAEIVTTSRWQDASGKEYLSIISKDAETGMITTTNQLLGQGKVASTGGNTKPTEAETKMAAKSSMAAQLKTVQGSDGYVSPENWRVARKAWAERTAYSGKDFDEQFRSYVNPQHPGDYEGFEEYGPNFTKTPVYQ